MLTINFHPFKNLETKRLLLRRVSNDDVNEILELRGNPETMKYIPRPLANTKDEALAHIKMINDKQLNVEMNLKIDFYVEKYFKLLELIPEYNKTDTLVYDKFPKITLYKYCDMYYVTCINRQNL